MRRAPALLALGALLLAGCTSAPPPAASAEPPAWRFVDTDGVEHSRATAAGDPAVLFFMASWCGSCRAMTGTLAGVHRDYAAQGLQLYTVTYDDTDTKATLEQWKQTYNQTWPHGLDPGHAMLRTFQVLSQSSIVVLDPRGHVVEKWSWPGASDEALRAALDRAFAAAEPAA